MDGEKSDKVKAMEAFLKLKSKTRRKIEERFRKDNGHQESSFRKAFAKVGRNEPCVCGSGKKYKKCCWENLHDVYVEVKHGESKDTVQAGGRSVGAAEARGEDAAS